MKKLFLLIIFMFSSTTLFAQQAVLMVSLGMPDQVLRSYLKQAKAYSIPVVIRGFYSKKNKGKTNAQVGIGDAKETVHRITEIMGQQNVGGISIDPTVFRSYWVGVVPALVVYDEDDTCKRQDNSKSYAAVSSDCFDVVYGNLALNKMLERVIEESDSTSRILIAKDSLGSLTAGGNNGF